MSMFYLSTRRLNSRPREWYDRAQALLDLERAREWLNTDDPAFRHLMKRGYSFTKIISTVFERLWHVRLSTYH